MILGSQKDIRTRVQEALLKHNIKQVDLARQTGIHHSTLSLWLQGKSKNHHAKNQEILQDWLKNLYLKPGSKVKKTKADTQAEDLIPITIDLEGEGKREQIFCWNYYQDQMTAQMFARLIAQQNGLTIQQEHEIAHTIKRKIQNHKPFTPSSNEEWLKTIELDIRVDKVNLRDKFQWDIANPNNSPQQFAYDMCKEMGLNSEFMVKIAHQIREQIIMYQKLGERDFKRPRDHAKDWLRLDDEGWEPKLQVLDAEDLRKMQKLKKRELRYINRIR